MDELLHGQHAQAPKGYSGALPAEHNNEPFPRRDIYHSPDEHDPTKDVAIKSLAIGHSDQNRAAPGPIWVRSPFRDPKLCYEGKNDQSNNEKGWRSYKNPLMHPQNRLNAHYPKPDNARPRPTSFLDDSQPFD